MSEGSISQEEIDALLSGVDMGGIGSGGSLSGGNDKPVDIPTLQKFADKMKDKFAEVVKSMTQKEASIESVTVEALGRDQLLAKLPDVCVSVLADYSAGLTGDHLFLLSDEYATKLVGFINQEENPKLDDMAFSVISEVISSHSGAEITELSGTGKLPGLATQPPEVVDQAKAMVRMPQGTFALFTYSVKLDGQDYTLWEAVSNGVADGMASALGGGSKPAAQPQQGFVQQPMGQMNAGGMNQMNGMAGMNGMMGMNQGQMQMGGMMGMQQPYGMNGGMMQNPPNVQSLQFPNLQQGMGSFEQGNISLLMDVKMELTVELGRTKKTIKDILGLGEGTIIELDKLAGEPVDILVNHKAIARGEVVVIDENFGVRVTEILPAIEHVSSSM